MISISNCAALASASRVTTSDLFPRIVLMAVFGLLYLVFAILFGVHLSRWDDNIPGRCYNSSHLALPNAHHPYVEKIYLGVTCLYMFSMLLVALTLAISRCKSDPTWGKRPSALADLVIKVCKLCAWIYDISSQFTHLGNWVDQQGLKNIMWYPFKIQIALARANPVLTVAMLQLPLHLYFIIRLRLTNEPLLSNGSDENQWGFGQIYALTISAGLVVECCKGYLSACISSSFCEYQLTQVRQNIGMQNTTLNHLIKVRRYLTTKLGFILDLLHQKFRIPTLLQYGNGTPRFQIERRRRIATGTTFGVEWFLHLALTFGFISS
jgi:hypothetical protein